MEEGKRNISYMSTQLQSAAYSIAYTVNRILNRLRTVNRILNRLQTVNRILNRLRTVNRILNSIHTVNRVLNRLRTVNRILDRLVNRSIVDTLLSSQQNTQSNLHTSDVKSNDAQYKNATFFLVFFVRLHILFIKIHFK